MELYDFILSLENELSYALKMKTVIYMMDNNDTIEHDPSIMNTSHTDGPEVFNIYVKVGELTIFHRAFDGKIFPPKVRYTVDVRPFLKDTLRELTDIFSNNNLTYKYLEFDLSK